MAVRFVLGRAGSGKTHHCVEAVLAALARRDDGRLILLVPEQASFQMERTLALRCPGGGYCRAEVLSFSRLVHRVWDELGVEPPLLSRGARALALRAVATRHAGSLRLFRTAADSSGFFAELDRLIEELLLDNVMPEDLAATSEALPDKRLRRKTAEIARLYRAYLDWLGPHRVDPALRLRVLRERLERSDWLRNTEVWVDGFAGFTGQERLTLVTLGRLAREVSITLLLDPERDVSEERPDPLTLFGRTVVTYQRLRAELSGAGVALRAPLLLTPRVPARFTHAPELAHLESRLAGEMTGGAQRETADTGAVRVLACATHRAEVRQAARFIRQKLSTSTSDLRFRDFAVIARDLEPFADTIAAVFGEYEIPYFLDRRRPLRGHALSRLVHGLLDAVNSDCSVAAMTLLLRTGLLPMLHDEADKLEELLVYQQMHGLATWQRPAWDFLSDEATLSRSSQSRQRRRRESESIRAGRLRIAAALDPLMRLARGARPASGRVWAAQLYEALVALGLPRRIEGWISAARAAGEWETAETHRAAWEALCDSLTELHDVLDESPLSTSDLVDILSSALGELTLGLAPPTLDQVLVSSIDRSRHPDIKHAWILAFNEGVFPSRPTEDTLLTTADRESLSAAGLAAPLPHRDDVFGERLLAYIACTRPSQSLTISYATTDNAGEPLPPSPLLEHLRRALPHLRPEREQVNAPPTTIRELVRDYHDCRASNDTSPAMARYMALRGELERDPTHAPLLQRLTRGERYANSPELIGNYRRRAEDAPDVLWTTSPSELETYIQCPFKHFVQYGLRVAEQRGPQPLSWDLGSLAHDLLAEVTRRALATGQVGDLSDGRWQELLDATLATQVGSRPPDLDSLQPRRGFLGGFQGEFTREVLQAHVSRWRRGEFEPYLCEQLIDDTDGALPVLRVPLADGGVVRVRGRIDRVDRRIDAQGTWLLLYDYKTKPHALTARFLTGDRLQLLLYALALREAGGDTGTTRIAGVFLAPLRPQTDTLKSGYVAEADDETQRMYLYRPRGLFTRAAAHMLDNGLGQQISPVAHMKLKKDGDFSASYRDVIADDALDARLELARATLCTAADAVARGVVDIAPLVENDTLACRDCSYNTLCRFDRAFNRPRPAETALPMLEDQS